MPNYDGATLEGQTLEADGSSFVGATLTKCTLVYRGGLLPNLANAVFHDSGWSFSDAAGRTLVLWALIEANSPPQVPQALLQSARDNLRMTSRAAEQKQTS